MKSTKIEYLRNELKNFRETCERMLECEERLITVADRLRGYAVRSIAYQNDGIKKVRNPYTSDTTSLMDDEERLNEERNFYLYAVRRMAQRLMRLNDYEVQLLYWVFEKELSYRAIAMMEHTNKNVIARDLENIIEKMIS